MVKIYHFKLLASTQEKAKELSRKSLSDAVIVADMQTKGRGRFNRKWHSAKGGLWMSILLKTEDVKNLQYLTFIAATATAKSINKNAKIDAKIKWPNDIYYKGRKLCGILTEGIFGEDDYAVIGIGININQKKFQNDIKGIATSLKIIKNKDFEIKKIMQNVLDEFFRLYNSYYRKNKFKNIQEIWKRRCDTINKNIIVSKMSKKIVGKAIGIDKDCNLLLRLDNKKIVKIIEGDVSIKYAEA